MQINYYKDLKKKIEVEVGEYSRQCKKWHL